MSALIDVVNVVRSIQLLEAKQRIHIDDVSFFSESDVWLYIEISDDRLCQFCKGNAERFSGKFTGLHLRAAFPNLVILDTNTIEVNEHPNCRCVLVRLHRINWRELS